MAFKVPNQYRTKSGPMASDDSIGLQGAFQITINSKIPLSAKYKLFCIADDGEQTGWAHVSCHKSNKHKRYIPTWNDMCLIKSLFWDEEDCVIQFHPPKSDYVNNNPYVLHLWKPLEFEILLPPKELI